MKMRRQHCVPLSRQVLEMLEVLHGLTGHGEFLFPSFRTSRRCMSENTVSAALRRLGYSREEMTAHGFRSTAATLLNQKIGRASSRERGCQSVQNSVGA